MFLFIFDSFIHFLYLSIVLSYIIFNIHTNHIRLQQYKKHSTLHSFIQIHSFALSLCLHTICILSLDSLNSLPPSTSYVPIQPKSKSKKKNELNEKTKLKPNRKQKKIPKNPTNYDLTKQSLWLAFPATLLQWTAG